MTAAMHLSTHTIDTSSCARLPIETLLLVVKYACDDSREAALSLYQVSKWTRDVCGQKLYKNIVLRSVRSIRLLCDNKKSMKMVQEHTQTIALLIWNDYRRRANFDSLKVYASAREIFRRASHQLLHSTITLEFLADIALNYAKSSNMLPPSLSIVTEQQSDPAPLDTAESSDDSEVSKPAPVVQGIGMMLNVIRRSMYNPGQPRSLTDAITHVHFTDGHAFKHVERVFSVFPSVTHLAWTLTDEQMRFGNLIHLPVVPAKIQLFVLYGTGGSDESERKKMKHKWSGNIIAAAMWVPPQVVVFIEDSESSGASEQDIWSRVPRSSTVQ